MVELEIKLKVLLDKGFEENKRKVLAIKCKKLECTVMNKNVQIMMRVACWGCQD